MNCKNMARVSIKVLALSILGGGHYLIAAAAANTSATTGTAVAAGRVATTVQAPVEVKAPVTTMPVPAVAAVVPLSTAVASVLNTAKQAMSWSVSVVQSNQELGGDYPAAAAKIMLKNRDGVVAASYWVDIKGRVYSLDSAGKYTQAADQDYNAWIANTLWKMKDPAFNNVYCILDADWATIGTGAAPAR